MQPAHLEAIRNIAKSLPPQFPDFQPEHQALQYDECIGVLSIADLPDTSTLAEIRERERREAELRERRRIEQKTQSLLKQDCLKDASVLSRDKLAQKYGLELAAWGIEQAKNQAPTPQQAYVTYQRQEREAKRELGRNLVAAGVHPQQHSVKEYTHAIVKQLDLQLQGENPSISTVLHAAFPNDPRKAASIRNSRNGARRKQAYNSDAVRNHPMEVAMQAVQGKNSMNRRCSAGTFGQSLAIGATLFENCDKITKLEARVQVLEQQIQSTKNRAALDDAGATSSRDKVLTLRRQGKGPTEIARLLDMKLDAVKYHLKKLSKEA